MPRRVGSHNQPGEHDVMPIGSVPPMQFPQERIREQRVSEGRLYAYPDVGESDTSFWRHENVLGKNLAVARESAGYTQDALAAALGTSVRTVKRFESGEAMPDVSKLRMISIITGTSTDWLLGLISDEMRDLLDYYEFATPTQRDSITRLAKIVQAGDEQRTKAMAEQDEREFLAGCERRTERLRQLEKRDS